jgi:diguanylate cyclase (GGDEF)-like protein/PAS domain S-box-containing protein
VLNRLSFKSRLILVAVVPLLGMLGLAVYLTWDRAEDLRRANEGADRVSAATALGDAMFHARGASTVAGGVGREDLGRLLAPIIETTYRRETDALAEARARLDGHADFMAGLIGEDEWRALEAALDERDALDRETLAANERGPTESNAAAVELLDVTDALARGLIEAQGEVLVGGAGEVARTSEPLGDVGDLPSNIYTQGELVFPAIVDDGEISAQGAAQLAYLRGEEQALVDELLAELPPPLAARLREIEASESTAAWAELRRRTEQSGLSRETPPQLGALELGQAGLGLKTRLDALDALRLSMADHSAEVAAHEIATARRSLIVAAGVTLLLTALTIALVVGLVSSLTRVVRRLAEQARRIQAGELSAPALPVEGPRDFRILTESFNDMTATLHGVETRAEAMAEGAPQVSDPLPGAIGAALDRSVALLSETTERLRAREALARSIVETAAEAVWTVDADGVVRTANAAAQRLSGLAEDQMVGQVCTTIPPVAAVCDVAKGGGGTDPAPLDGVELELPHRQGHVVPSLVSTRAVPDEDGRPLWTVFAVDITERHEHERALAHEATHDGLTGLANRGSALTALGVALGRAAEGEGGCGLLFLDLDNFKQVNDTLGHRAGDRLLVHVANRLCGLVRPDDLVARLGGDEFVVVLSSDTRDVVLDIADRVIEGLAAPFDIVGERAWASGSIGISWNERGDQLPEDMLRDADIALYRAKRSGRGTVCLFDDSMRNWTAARAATEQALRTALAGPGLADRYQPIVDLETGDVVGAELLARLPSPEGEIQPALFIDVAEESGLVIEVGRWALRAACRRIAEWEAAGHGGFRISVNVSALHLAGGTLIRDVREAAGMLDGGLNRLGIEITESFLLHDEQGARVTLRALRQMGVMISLDDFGTGYSSLAYLRNLPIDVVKVDRSFVSEMEESPLDGVIIESVAGLAHARGLRVVAEGIETQGQAARVREAGCGLGQGYLFSKPVPFDELQRWTLARREALLRASPDALPHPED